MPLSRLTSIILSVILFALGFLPHVTSFVYAYEWQVLQSDHFIIYYTAEEKSVKLILRRAEEDYNRVALDLHYPRYDGFWTWSNRAKIYIYPDREAYIRATGQPKWSEGAAFYKKRSIAGFASNQQFIEDVLPHEIAHLTFRDFIGFKGQVPLWLDEGVAQWEEYSKRRILEAKVMELFEDDSLISLDEMMRLNVKKVSDDSKIYIKSTKTKDGDPAVLFLSGDNLVNVYYLQAFSIVGFLIEKYGSFSFAEFCRQLRDGKKLEEALTFAYPTEIRGIKELEDKWRFYLKNTKFSNKE